MRWAVRWGRLRSTRAAVSRPYPSNHTNPPHFDSASLLSRHLTRLSRHLSRLSHHLTIFSCRHPSLLSRHHPHLSHTTSLFSQAISLFSHTIYRFSHLISPHLEPVRRWERRSFALPSLLLLWLVSTLLHLGLHRDMPYRSYHAFLRPYCAYRLCQALLRISPFRGRIAYRAGQVALQVGPGGAVHEAHAAWRE